MADSYPPCARCGDPARLDAVDCPPGSLAFHTECYREAHEQAHAAAPSYAPRIERIRATKRRQHPPKQQTPPAKPPRDYCRWVVMGTTREGGKVSLSAAYGDRQTAERHRDTLREGGCDAYATIEVEGVRDVFS